MCGIVGILDLDGGPVEVSELQRMNAAIRHRGPDDHGYFVDAGIGLGMSRLSIIDLDTGHQPIGNEDGSVWIVFNGEIYNYRELRADLESRGHRFRTTSDTETIVHLYEEEGADCVERLRGMFAFALWDARRKRLLLARDRFGIKPLYYGVVGGRLLFASELKAILELPEVDRRIDWRALDHLLTTLVTPPDRSIVEGIGKLRPAHVVTASPGGEPRERRYWSLHYRPRRDLDDDHFVGRLRELLHECVQMHMLSDVPVGAFLSGGMDSSSVVAAMQSQRSEPVKTYSIGFPDPDFDEADDARLVADFLGTDHRAEVVEPDVVEILDRLAWHLDEPFGDSSAIPTFIVSELAAREVKVVLSGDGGDEMFAGYDDYVYESRERWLRFMPSPLRWIFGFVSRRMEVGATGRNFLRHLSFPEKRRYLDHSVLFRSDERRSLLNGDIASELGDYDPLAWQVEALASYGGNWLSQLQRFDVEAYLPLDILTKVDRTSMAHSLEVRVPLLDHVLAEFAATIPPERLLRKQTTKYPLKQAMRGVLPDHTLEKEKQGFAIPLGRWMQGQLAGLVDELLLSETVGRRGILQPGTVEQFVRLHRGGRELDLHIWTLMSLELWCRRFLDGRAAALPRASKVHELRPRDAGTGTVWSSRRWRTA